MAHAPAHAHAPARDHAAAGHDDAHGSHDHGHVVVSLFTLRTILALLLFFTLLTVGLALAEQAIAHTFNFTIPQSVNVLVAISIAVVKTALVVMFFMQLKYDNPMNTAIFIFTMLTVLCFLSFTMLDLGQRKSISRYKGQYVQTGGTGGLTMGTLEGYANMSIAQAARMRAEQAGKKLKGDHGHGPARGLTQAGYLPEEPATGSSSNFSRPVTGLTLPELAPAKTEDDAHAKDKPGAPH
jgi:cytochrome c oxidase subunit 4